MLTCLDLAWAAVGPFFLKTVTVSQSLSAIFAGLKLIPVMFRTIVIRKTSSVSLKLSFQRALLLEIFVPRFGQSFIYNSSTSSDIMAMITAPSVVGGQRP